MSIYDGRLDEPFTDAPLHDSCAVCFSGALADYFEQVDGRCTRCRELDERELAEQAECATEEAA